MTLPEGLKTTAAASMLTDFNIHVTWTEGRKTLLVEMLVWIGVA